MLKTKPNRLKKAEEPNQRTKKRLKKTKRTKKAKQINL